MNQAGFTLIELMIAVAVVGILATMAVPSYSFYVVRAQIQEGLDLTKGIKPAVEEYYKQAKALPSNHNSVDLPSADKYIGNYVTRIALDNGALHIYLGNRTHKRITGKVLSVRPIIVPGSPKSPISWICGYAQAPNGMQDMGENKTNIAPLWLPSSCRSWKKDS
jgi:type IV pilus assembly protein PilA